MNQTIEERLAFAKKLATDSEKKRIQLETKLEAAQEAKQQLLAKCEQLNVKPEELSAKIQELEQLIETGMQELESLFPTNKLKIEPDLPY